MESKHLVYFLEPQPEEGPRLTPEQIMGSAWDELKEAVENDYMTMEEAIALFNRTFPDTRE